MGRYVDGFVIPVASDDVDEYRAVAEEACEVFLDHGALEYYEGVGDDLDPETGDVDIVTFPELAGADAEENVIFSFIAFESRDHRDEVMAAAMEDPRMQFDPESMPFDPERMATGGFQALVDSEE